MGPWTGIVPLAALTETSFSVFDNDVWLGLGLGLELAPLQAEVGLWSTVARISVAINVLLLLGLGYVWARNYLQFRSKHTLGLFVFSVLLLAENAVSLYYYLLDPTLSAWFATQVPAIAWRAMMVLHVLETAALLFLTWVTWD